MADVEILVADRDGLTLDLLLWQRFRRAYAGMVERTLDINPGLSATAILQLGRRVRVERPAANATGRTVPVTTLWG